MNFLEQIKAGDRVMVEEGYSYTTLAIEAVEKVTRTQIVLPHDRRFSRSDGLLRGSTGYRPPAQIVERTPERDEKLRRAEAWRTIELASRHCWKTLPLEQLEQAAKLLAKPEATA